jgi:hypothetical protein
MADSDISGLVISGLEKLAGKMDGLKSRATVGMGAYLNTTVYQQIQNFQMQRFMTEGASEGDKWEPLSSSIYGEYKRKRYGGGQRFSWVGGRGSGMPWAEAGNWPNYPGSGTKLLIATGALAGSIIGPQEGGSPFGLTGPFTAHRKLVSENSIFVGVSDQDLSQVRDEIMAQEGKKKKGPSKGYAFDVNEKRNFSKLSEESKGKIFAGIIKYIKAGSK